MSTEIIERLNKKIIALIADPGVKTRLLALGVESKPMTSSEFGEFIAEDIAKWAKVIKFASIKPG
jgi:tripartite-type tricarboxylate transporter receptor subunit TctC